MAPRWSKAYPPTDSNFMQGTPSKSGGQSLLGFEQVVVSSAGRWLFTATFHISRFRGPFAGAGLLYWRWFGAYMQGRANAIIMPVFDNLGTSPAELANQAAPGLITHDDGTTLSDGTCYVQPRSPAHVAGAYVGGETAMLVNMLAVGQVLQAGQRFSVGDRLYVIEAAAPYIAAPLLGEAPNYWQLTIWPPVREPISDGTFADFDDPRCLLRLAKDDTAALTLKPGFQGDVSIDFVEAPLGA